MIVALILLFCGVVGIALAVGLPLLFYFVSEGRGEVEREQEAERRYRKWLKRYGWRGKRYYRLGGYQIDAKELGGLLRDFWRLGRKRRRRRKDG